jgi:hypothetical protein
MPQTDFDKLSWKYVLNYVSTLKRQEPHLVVDIIQDLTQASQRKKLCDWYVAIFKAHPGSEERI